MATPAPSNTPVQTHSNLADASFGELTARLSEQMSRLIHDELALAQLEAKEKAKRLGLGVGMFGASGFAALLGVLCGLAAVILGLATVLPGWLAALLVAGALFMVAGALALSGRSGMRRASPPIPKDALESTKADVAAVRAAVKQ